MKEELENQVWEELERLWGEHDERVEQLAREHPPQKKSQPRILPFWRYAAAAMMAGLLAVGAWLWMDKPAKDASLLAENKWPSEKQVATEDTLHGEDQLPAKEKSPAKEKLAAKEKSPAEGKLPAEEILVTEDLLITEEMAATEEMLERSDNRNPEIRPQKVADKEIPSLVEEVVRVDFLAEETPSRPDPIKVWSEHKPNIIEHLAQGFQRRRENRKIIRDGIMAEKL